MHVRSSLDVCDGGAHVNWRGLHSVVCLWCVCLFLTCSMLPFTGRLFYPFSIYSNIFFEQEIAACSFYFIF